MIEDIRNFKENNDWESFKRIYKKLEKTIKYLSDRPIDKTLTNFSHYPSKQEKEEIQSELKLKLIDLIKEYNEGESNFLYYARKKLKFHAHNFVRLGYVVEHKEEHLTELMDTFEKEETEIPLEDERIEKIKQHLHKLPDKQRRVIEMILIEKMRNKDIAKELNMDRREVSKHRKLAIEKLKDLI